MSALPKSLSRGLTVDEFLAWPGDGTGRKHQLVDGEPRAMAPASATHAFIQAAFARLLGNHLAEARPQCRIGTEPAVVPRVKAETNMRVPDLGVTCASDSEDDRYLRDPVLLIEILSPTNQAETWESVRAYTTIPTVREIVVVHSIRIAAELLRRQADGTWPEETDEIGPEDVLELQSIGFRSALRAFYLQTDLVRRPSRIASA